MRTLEQSCKFHAEFHCMGICEVFATEVHAIRYTAVTVARFCEFFLMNPFTVLIYINNTAGSFPQYYNIMFINFHIDKFHLASMPFHRTD